MKKILLIIAMILIVSPVLSADSAEDSIAAKVDDLFMKASSGEVQFRDLVEPAKKELIEMGESAVPQMITKLKTEDARERHTVEDIFKEIGDPAVPYLIEALDTENLYQMRLGASCLGKIGSKEATPALLKLLGHSDHTVRSAAVTAVGEIKDTSAVPNVIRTLSDGYETVRKSAAVALGRIGYADDDVIYALIRKLGDIHFSVRYTAAGSLIKLGDKAGDKLVEQLDNSDESSINYFMEVWAGLKYKKALPVLEKLLKSDDPYLRGHAILAMAKIDPGKAGKLIRKYNKKETDIFARSCYDMAGQIIDDAEK